MSENTYFKNFIQILENWFLQRYHWPMLLLLFSHPVMSDSLWPFGLQHSRPPCPLPSSGVCPSSCFLHRWCCSVTASSDGLFSFCSQSSPASGTFPMSCLFASDEQNTEAEASASVLPAKIRSWSPLSLTAFISLLSMGLSGVFSSTTVKSVNSMVLCLLYGPALTPEHDHWEEHSLDYIDIC